MLCSRPGSVFSCCRRAVRAGLSTGAAHPGVHDRGRHIRHDQDGVAAVPAGEVAAVQQAPAAGHGHARGHGVVDGLADRRGRAHRVPGRLVRAGQLLDTVRVLARLGAVVVVRAERVVQPHAVRHQSGAPGPGVRGRSRRPGRRRRRPRVPAVPEIAYGQHRAVRLRARPSPTRPPHDHHRHTAVQRHTHQRHAAAGRRRGRPFVLAVEPRDRVRRGPVNGRWYTSVEVNVRRLTLPEPSKALPKTIGLTIDNK